MANLEVIYFDTTEVKHIPPEELTNDQTTLDQALEDGELSDQEYSDMSGINYLLGLE